MKNLSTRALIVLIAAWLFDWAPDTPAATAAEIESPIIFTQIPAGLDVEKAPGNADGMLRASYGDGARVVRLDPDGRLQTLTQDFNSACEPDISFDAKRILFAAKRTPQDKWNIWEMNADGSGPRQITRNLGNCRSPAYQATLYTIVSTEPWYQIMFVSDAAAAMNEYGSGAATSLYSCKLDGSAVRRLTMNLSDDMDPFLMDDGRVLLASWQRMDLRRGISGRVALFGVNIDGADYALFSGDQGGRIKHMPCVTTDGLVVFVEADRVGWDGAGRLASVTLRRNFHSHRIITRDWSAYHSPSPLRDGDVLVSCRPIIDRPTTGKMPMPQEQNKTHGIYRLDPRTGRKQRVYDDPQFHDMHVKALAPRPEPDGRSSVVNEKYPTGKLYCLNAYITDPAVIPHIRPGMIHSLRVVEGVPLSAADVNTYLPTSADTGIGGPGSTVNSLVPIVQKRLLGVVPVEQDGSFQIELPPDVPVQLQTLDASGMALRSCGWIWCKHREPRGCIGCHEDPELTPENRFVLAVRKPAVNLTLLAEKRRSVDFRRDVMPIIADKCAPCHNSATASLDLRAERQHPFNRAYASLLSKGMPSLRSDVHPADLPVVGKYVHPGQARTSPLIWRLFGRNTSRPWDAAYSPKQSLPICPPAGADPLTDDEKLILIEWIDLGAHWDGIPGSNEMTKGREAGMKSEGT